MIEAKPTVLDVDESKAILRIMARILERNGYSVVAAETGLEAEKKLQTHIYDATLLSSELSDMDITTLLRKIHEKAPNTLKIVLTNSPL
jgi:CheY-like chemotaxis protein